MFLGARNNIIKSKMQIVANNEQDNLIAVGSPIVLQRRGSVYGANVPMITGTKRDLIYLLFISVDIFNIANKNKEFRN